MRTPFPLQWPPNTPRTPAGEREKPHLHPRFAPDRDETISRLERRGGTNIVITSNLPTNRYGQPINATGVDDPGIAVWWVEGGTERVLPMDRWSTAAFNMRALCKTVEAICGLDRWGTSVITSRAMAGFAALPPGSEDPRHRPPPTPQPKRTWRQVFDMQSVSTIPKADQALILNARYKERILKAHPDRNPLGHHLTVELNVALQEAERELGLASGQ